MRFDHLAGSVLCGTDGPTPSKSMSTDIPQTETENAQLPTDPLISGPVDLVCPADGTTLSETHALEGDVYQCPTCDRVRSEEVLRR